MKRARNKWNYSILLLLFISLSMTALNTRFVHKSLPQENNEPLSKIKDEDLISKRMTQPTAHSPIFIINDADFGGQALSEGWPGYGTKSNPYRIENLAILGSSIDFLIEIRDTDVYFQIKNCLLQGGRDGIILDHVTNGKIVNNVIYNNYGSGISLSYSNTSIIVNNTITNNNGVGLYLEYSYYNVFVNNTITDTHKLYPDEIQELHSTGYNIHSHTEVYQQFRPDFSSLGQIDIYLRVQYGNPDNLRVALGKTHVGNLIWETSLLGAEIKNGWVQIPIIPSVALIPGDLYLIIVGNKNGGGDVRWMGKLRYDVGEQQPYPKGSSSENIEFDFAFRTWSYTYAGMFILSSGVSLYHSGNNTLTGNTITNNYVPGISLDHSGNSTLSDNKISNNSEIGLSLDHSGNSTLVGNTIENHDENAMSLVFSGNSTLSSNAITNNSKVGISLDYSENSTLISNTILHNQIGLNINNSSNCTIVENNFSANFQVGCILQSGNNIISNNSFLDDGILLFGKEIQKCLQREVLGNEINGKSLIFWQNIDEGTVSSGAGQIILVNCSDVNILNQTLSQTSLGLVVAFCVNVTVQSNSFSNNNFGGLLLWNSTNSRILDNNISNINNDGITLHFSYNSILSGNHISNISKVGIHLISSWDCNISRNSVYNTEDSGIDTFYSENNIYSDNILFNASWAGFHLFSSKNSIVSDNTISFTADTGIYLESSENFTVSSNSILHTGSTGIYFKLTQNSMISNNIIENSNNNGIDLWESYNCTLIFNNITNNQEMGVKLFFSRNNTLSGNTVLNNSWDGIFLYKSGNSFLTYNAVSNNTGKGISFFASGSSTIGNNVIGSNEKDGIHLSYSRETSLINNKIFYNEHTGISLSNSRSSVIERNELLENNFSIRGHDPEDFFQARVINNTIEGKPLIYWQNRSGDLTTAQAGYVILIQCDSVGIINQTLNGIQGYYSTNLEIWNNTIVNSIDSGLYLYKSENSTILNNIVTNNRKKGIFLFYSRNSTITANIIGNNEGDSIFLRVSSDNVIENNSFINNTGMGILLSDSSTNAISYNFIKSNGEFGVGLDEYSSFNTVVWNIFISNNQGSHTQVFDDGENNIIFNNYWDSWKNSDNNTDGIVDEPHHISGIAQNEDPRPLVSPVSPSSPYISHIFPSQFFLENSTTFTGANVISWSQAIDLLGHPEVYSLYYSPNGSGNWELITSDLEFLSYEWNTTLLDDGTDYFLKLVANCTNGEDQVTISEPFTLYNHFIENQGFIYPQSVTILTGISEISWFQAVDHLGHSVTYSLYYSLDGGTSWELLELNSSNLSYEWDTTKSFDGSDFLLKVFVNCSEGLSLFFVSNPFIIYNNNPIPLNSTTLFPTTNF
ncbi:MAG: right-handed parallel beta-helix repeat-containing protein, partial [Candidatus Hodarchaeales archaeon]